MGRVDWRQVAAAWLAVLCAGIGAGYSPAAAPGSAASAASVAEAGGGAAVVRQAETALSELDEQKLAGPFGGAPPAWAREWVDRRGHDDLFERQWHGRAVRLPAPYHGLEWVGVFSMYHPVEADADHFHTLQQRNGVWTLGAEIPEREPAAEYRITHHDLRVRLLPAEHRLTATDRMTVQRLAGARGLMLARMSEDLDVTAVRIAGADTAFARAGGLLAIVIPPGPPAPLTVTLEYHGVVHHPGMDDIDPDGSFLFSYWYPNIARLPASADLTATAPAAWSVIAEGEQQRREPAGAEARTEWRQTHPVCWLQLAAGPYQQTSRRVGDKTFNIFLLKPDPKHAEAALETLAQALPVYSRLFSPFPWTHYDVVEYPMTVGALEGYTMTTMSMGVLRAALPHELAHSWWGGLVPNTYTIDMWNEAFATYSERLLSERLKPSTEPGTRPGEGRPRGSRIPPHLPITGAVDALDPPQARVGYEKGAAVLRMFRRTVGDTAFHQTLARFVRDTSGQAANWRDFQHAAEQVVGHQMGDFFDPWLTRADVPRLRWGSARQQSGSVEADIEMTTPAYHLHLPVAIDTADGQRRIEMVDVAGPRSHFHVAVGSRAVRLVLDPGADFLLAPADDRHNPWTLELPPVSVADAPPERPSAGRKAPNPPEQFHG